MAYATIIALLAIVPIAIMEGRPGAFFEPLALAYSLVGLVALFGFAVRSSILAVAGSIPGHEIEHPMAIVILGGLVTSTLLNLFVLPSLYLRFGRSRKARMAAAA